MVVFNREKEDDEMDACFDSGNNNGAMHGGVGDGCKGVL